MIAWFSSLVWHAGGRSPLTEEPGGDHARGACLLSGARAAKKRRESVSGRHDRSDDREEVRPGHDPVLHSARRRGSGQSGNCNWGYSCAYTNSISWPTPTQPLPTEVNPRMAFERLFGDGASPEERLPDASRTPAFSIR